MSVYTLEEKNQNRSMNSNIYRKYDCSLCSRDNCRRKFKIGLMIEALSKRIELPHGKLERNLKK